MSDGGGIGTPAGLGGVEISTDAPALPYPPDHGGDPAGDRQTSRGFDKSKPKSAREDEPADPKDSAAAQGKTKKRLEGSLDRAFAKAGKGEARDAVGGELPDPSGALDPTQPPRNANFSKEATADWGKVPPSVQAEVHRRYGELEAGIGKYREAAHQWQQLEPFDRMARQYRTSLPTKLSQYVNLETSLLNMQSPARREMAIRHLVEFGKITVDELNRVFNETPEAKAARVAGEKADRLERQVFQLTQAVQGGGQPQQQQQALGQQILAGVQTLATTMGPEFDELAPLIAEDLRRGTDSHLPPLERLAHAYQRARGGKRNGAGRKSIAGSPANGSDPSLLARKKGGTGTIDDSLDRAFAKAGV